MIYQNENIMLPLIESLEKTKPEGSKVIWRDAFRWKDEDGILSNHYESQNINQLAEDFGYIVLENFNHVAIIKEKL